MPPHRLQLIVQQLIIQQLSAQQMSILARGDTQRQDFAPGAR
jgi:hypothetical protein